MGKGELWDDSALINAFDEAISTYKKMHGKGYKETSPEVSGDVKNSTRDSPLTVDVNHQHHQSHMETVGGENDAPHAAVEVEEVEKLGTAEGNEGVNSQACEEEHALGSNSLPIQDESHQPHNQSSSVVVDDYNQLAVDEYNQLYKQYYEVEEQRQRILQRMQQFSSSTYTDAGETSVSGLQWGTNSANQAYQSTASQVPCGTMVVTCCPCACPCSMASCSSLSCVSPDAFAGTRSTNAPAAVVPEKHPEDVDIVKMAMGAAERAISSLKDKTAGLKEENNDCSGMEQSVSSETDLSVVLNAWFSAGFHTGKYLTEQSLAKKRPS